MRLADALAAFDDDTPEGQRALYEAAWALANAYEAQRAEPARPLVVCGFCRTYYDPGPPAHRCP